MTNQPPFRSPTHNKLTIPHYSNQLQEQIQQTTQKPNTRANIMQQEVAFLDSYMKTLYKSQSVEPNKQIQRAQKVQQGNINANINANNNGKKHKFGIEHVVVYSSLSKCRIWPKVLKSGIGFVPTLINFYNNFTKQYKDCLDFKFDPVILTQKYTKIMQKANLKKKDHPKLVSAIKNSNMQLMRQLLDQLQQKQKEKNQQQQVDLSSIINNIYHQGKALTHICCQFSSFDTIKYLASIGADFQLIDQEKQTALFYAVKRADIQIVKYLVEQIKVNINHREYQQRTVLYLAAFQGDLQIVDYLYKKGANPQFCSKLDRTPLSKACYLGNIKVVKYLLSINVDMLKQDNKGRTALHNAAWGVEGGRDGKRRGHIMLQDSPQSVELLVKAGHPVDMQDYDGFTPLFSAVSSMGVRSLRLLVEYGANLNHKTKNQQTAVFIAAKYGHVQMLKILIQEYKLNYTDADFHGYSPLCAAITLQNKQTFFYLCNLYMKNNIPIQMNKIIQCCIQYQTTQNIKFIKLWMLDGGKQQNKMDKFVYLSKSIQQLYNSLIQLKNRKIQIKQQLQTMNRAKGAIYKGQVTQQIQKQLQTIKQKQKQQKYRLFEKILQKKLQDQQLTQDKDNTNNNTNPNTNTNNNDNMKVNKNKQLDTIRKLYNNLLDTTAYILIQLQSNIRHIAITQYKNKQLQLCIQQIRNKYITNYNTHCNRYKQIINYILNQCIYIWNKSKKTQITDITTIILQLAKALNPNKPTIPAHIHSNHTIHNNQLKLNHNQSTHDILKLLTNKQVIINLTSNHHNLMDTLFKLAKYRQTAVIIGIFSAGSQIGGFCYDDLLKFISNNHHPQNNTTNTTSQSQSVQRLTLIQYCILHGIGDIGVYLQQICNTPQTQFIVKIPQYQINRIQLPIQQTNIELQSVDQWVLDVEQIINRMSQKQRSIYMRFIQQQNRMTQNLQQQSTNNTQYKFQTCQRYHIIDNKTKLLQLQQALQKSILIGIDVQHYNVSKQQYFICSIQISNGQAVYIIDPLNHLHNGTGGEDAFTPDDIGMFMRKLMSDWRKIKIFHAYENDVKWIHEDFNLYAYPQMENTHKNCNVMDTSRIYTIINKSKKGDSIGLKKLCERYLNYEMDKNFQRSDWRIRPLFKEMVQYAAIDAEVLPYVYLRMLTIYKDNKHIMDKLKQGFCTKRAMKTRGVRNRLVPTGQGKNKIKQQVQVASKT